MFLYQIRQDDIARRAGVNDVAIVGTVPARLLRDPEKADAEPARKRAQFTRNRLRGRAFQQAGIEHEQDAQPRIGRAERRQVFVEERELVVDGNGRRERRESRVAGDAEARQDEAPQSKDACEQRRFLGVDQGRPRLHAALEIHGDEHPDQGLHPRGQVRVSLEIGRLIQRAPAPRADGPDGIAAPQGFLQARPQLFALAVRVSAVDDAVAEQEDVFLPLRRERARAHAPLVENPVVPAQESARLVRRGDVADLVIDAVKRDIGYPAEPGDSFPAYQQNERDPGESFHETNSVILRAATRASNRERKHCRAPSRIASCSAADMANQRVSRRRVPSRSSFSTRPAPSSRISSKMFTLLEMSAGRPQEIASETDIPKFSWCEGSAKTSAARRAPHFLSPERSPVHVKDTPSSAASRWSSWR